MPTRYGSPDATIRTLPHRQPPVNPSIDTTLLLSRDVGGRARSCPRPSGTSRGSGARGPGHRGYRCRARRSPPGRRRSSSKSKTRRFSAIRCGRIDLGIGETPCWTCQRRTICAGVLPYFPPRSRSSSARSSGRRAPAHACRAAAARAADRRPGLGDDAVRGMRRPHRQLRVVRVELDLVDGRHDPRARQELAEELRRVVAETPIARTRPSASSRSSGAARRRRSRRRVGRHRPVQQVEVDERRARAVRGWRRKRGSARS